MLSFITARYGLAPNPQVTPVQAGYLSENCKLTTATGSYFLKQYRFTSYERVAAAHAAKHFFHAAGIPVILPLATHDGETICTSEGRYYSLFPWVAGRQLRRGNLSTTAVRSAATMLARLHRAGYAVHLPHVRVNFKPPNVAAFQSSARQILAQINAQPVLSEFDLLAQQTLQLKLALAATTPIDFNALALTSDHLLHGDYHDSNLFFDAADQVSHVFDWEKTIIAPRETELMRALLFICFSNPHDFQATFAPHNFALGAAFLAAYHARYPLDCDRVIEALQARYWHTICSLWVEEEHYRNANQRVDPFLISAWAELQYFSQHFATFVTWLRSCLLD